MKSILIVISAPDALDRFSEILSNAGYHIIAAESGEEAIELATSIYPDLFLIAIVMPTLDGLQTASRLRALLGPKSGPIVLLGTVTPIGIDEKPLASLVNGYLNLDVSPDELLACVAKHAGSSGV
jgi:CheY-like chemotaxis protein